MLFVLDGFVHVSFIILVHEVEQSVFTQEMPGKVVVFHLRIVTRCVMYTELDGTGTQVDETVKLTVEFHYATIS